MSSNTALRAVQELNRIGLTRSESGRGVVVRARPPVRRAARTRAQRREDQRGFYGALEDAGLKPEVKTDIRPAPIPANLAEILGVEPGTEVLIRDRHMGTPDDPLQLATSYFLPEVAERIPQLGEHDTGPGGMYARMEDAGYELRLEEIVGARMPLPEETTALKLVTETPLLTIIRVAYGQNDRPLEVCDTRLASDRYELSYDVT
ncbi:MAG: GntR family transcriptional regulator [Egibacteraceae bacterium]